MWVGFYFVRLVISRGFCLEQDLLGWRFVKRLGFDQRVKELEMVLFEKFFDFVGFRLGLRVCIRGNKKFSYNFKIRDDKIYVVFSQFKMIFFFIVGVDQILIVRILFYKIIL